MEIIELMNYGVLSVVIGVISCIIAGIAKTPIKIAFKKKVVALKEQKNKLSQEYLLSIDDAKKTEIVGKINDIDKKVNLFDNCYIRLICHIITISCSIVGVLIFYGITQHSWAMFCNKAIYADMTASYAVAQIVYALYENLGMKKLILSSIALIKAKRLNKTKNKNDALIKGLELIEQVLEKDMNIVLSSEQKQVFEEKYKLAIKK